MKFSCFSTQRDSPWTEGPTGVYMYLSLGTEGDRGFKAGRAIDKRSTLTFIIQRRVSAVGTKANLTRFNTNLHSVYDQTQSVIGILTDQCLPIVSNQ